MILLAAADQSNVFLDILAAAIPIGGYHISYVELIGVIIGFAGAILGMKRSMFTWPVGAIANVMLFFVYAGVVFGLQDGRSPAFGQAGRQIFFLIMAAYGWWQWTSVRRRAGSDDITKPAIVPRWATASERLQIVIGWIVLTVVVHWAFAGIGYFWPAPDWFLWTDSWIFVGSLIATYAMARGWNEFWLCWLAVDLVGVPTLWIGNYVPTAVLYIAYGLFVIYGLMQWIKASKTSPAGAEGAPATAG